MDLSYIYIKKFIISHIDIMNYVYGVAVGFIGLIALVPFMGGFVKGVTDAVEEDNESQYTHGLGEIFKEALSNQDMSNLNTEELNKVINN